MNDLHAAVAADDDPDTALRLSLQRLALSRQLLRDTLLPPPGHEDNPTGKGMTRLLPRRLRMWLRRGPIGPVVRTLDPWLGAVQRTLGRWWRRHPLRPTVEMAGGSFEQHVLPWIRHHPTLALALGGAAGAGLALAAPWRWHALRHAARGSGRGLQRWALRQMTNPAAQAVLASVVASLWTAQAQQSSAQPHAAAAPPPGSGLDAAAPDSAPAMPTAAPGGPVRAAAPKSASAAPA